MPLADDDHPGAAVAADPDTSSCARARVHARDDADALTAATAPVPPTSGVYLGGVADSRLRRSLSRLRRRKDPELHALAEQLAVDAAAYLLNLAARADAADPVLQRRLTAQDRRAARLDDEVDAARRARVAGKTG